MTDEFRDERRLAREDRDALSASSAPALRHVNEPLFTGADMAAFVVTLVMVCGPLAMGAFGF